MEEGEKLLIKALKENMVLKEATSRTIVSAIETMDDKTYSKFAEEMFGIGYSKEELMQKFTGGEIAVSKLAEIEKKLDEYLVSKQTTDNNGIEVVEDESEEEISEEDGLESSDVMESLSKLRKELSEVLDKMKSKKVKKEEMTTASQPADAEKKNNEGKPEDIKSDASQPKEAPDVETQPEKPIEKNPEDGLKSAPTDKSMKNPLEEQNEEDGMTPEGEEKDEDKEEEGYNKKKEMDEEEVITDSEEETNEVIEEADDMSDMDRVADILEAQQQQIEDLKAKVMELSNRVGGDMEEQIDEEEVIADSEEETEVTEQADDNETVVPEEKPDEENKSEEMDNEGEDAEDEVQPEPPITESLHIRSILKASNNSKKNLGKEIREKLFG